MNKRLFTLLFSTLLCALAFAVPAQRGQYKLLTLADGSQVRAQLVGDEYSHYWLTDDGKMYQQDYVKNIFLPVTRDFIKLQAETNRKEFYSVPEMNGKMKQNRVAIDGVRRKFTGKKKCLCILVEFADQQFQSGHDVELYKNYINGIDYTNPEIGQIGSVRDYFLAQSFGQFDIDFDIVGPVKMPNNTEYYGAPANGQYDKNVRTMVSTAIQMADPYVNYSDYDWDADGMCEAIFFLYAGKGEAAGGAPETIWPHKGYINYLYKDNVVITEYACGAELDARGNLAGIGTMCHEYSHCLGLPDMYDTSEGDNYGTGDWDIMCSGNYNGNAFLPAAYNAYERWYAGWLDYTELRSDTKVDNLKPLTSGGEAFIIYNDAHPAEYFLVENRNRESYDAGLPNDGLLIYHVNYDKKAWQSNLVNVTSSSNDHQHFLLMACDNLYSIGSAKGDAYPSTNNNMFVNGSYPGQTLYFANSDGTYTLNKPITNITKNADGTITFDFANQVGNLPQLPYGVAFYEGFSLCNGIGANDGTFVKNTTASIVTDNPGWDVSVANGAYQCARFGNNSSKGTTVTPEFTIDGTYDLMFKAAPFYTDDANITIGIESGNAKIEGTTTLKMSPAKWTDYSLKLTGKGKVKLSFSAKKRFYLDEVLVRLEGVDGIEEVQTTSNHTEKVYNLTGMKVGVDYKGIVIVNGRKMLRK